MSGIHKMSLFEVLSYNERIVVWSSQEDCIIYTWNQSSTLQCWGEDDDHMWYEVDILTLSEEPAGFNVAMDAAISWHVGEYGDSDEG